MIQVEIPEGFPFQTNTGLHGDMQFFETGEHQMTIDAPQYKSDTVSFTYTCWDSDEGSVTISYMTITGEDALGASDTSWDVSVTTGSDVWGLADTAAAISEAIALHEALGRDVPFAR